MRNALLCGLVMFIASGCMIFVEDDHDKDKTFREVVPFSIPVSDITQLVVENINGNIEIWGTSDVDMIEVVLTKEVRARTMSAAQAHITDIIIMQYENNHSMNLVTDINPQHHDIEYQVDYELTVPLHLLLNLRAVNGNIFVDESNNDVSIFLSNGNVDLGEIIGNVEVSNSNGNVDLDDLTGNFECGLANGNVNANVSILSGGYCDIELSNGNIFLGLPASTSAELMLSLVNGTYSVTGLSATVEMATPNQYQGILGSGDGMISASLINGNIFLDSYTN